MNDDEQARAAVAIRQAIRSCTRCSLRSEGTAPVPWSGPLNPEVAVLGEAPGRTEDREGRPFVGPAGNLLRGVLKQAGFDPTKVTYINSANCWPSHTRTPTPEHLDECRIHLASQLAVVLPSYLIIVGLTAFNNLFKGIALKDIRGRPLWLERVRPLARFDKPITVFATYHPAAVLGGRNPQLRGKIEEDIMEFRRWKESGESFPGTCVKCGEEVEKFDEWGLAWCQRHIGRQMELKL